MLKGYLSVPSADAEKQAWISEEKVGCFIPTNRQKSSSPRKLLRSRTRGIKLISTFLFCTISMYFIHRFINNYIEFSK